MNETDLQQQILEIEKEISLLPPGSITKKTVKGHDYYYYRKREEKGIKEKYISQDNLEPLSKKIQKRKELEQKLKKLKNQTSSNEYPKMKISSNSLTMNVIEGESLLAFSNSVKNYKKRACFQQLHNFVYGDIQDKILILYGLRRTGKTTMIRQLINDMNSNELAKTAFIQITSKNTLAETNKTLKELREKGFNNIFIDEVTLLEDFIDGAALFSDIFATFGMKIILSGTDSLGFLFAEDEQLYDRCIFIHTTFISYREFESVLGIKGIDEYIRYGGTMSMGGIHYNETSTFANKENADEYVDTAIARNIQHSLRCYQHEGHFRALWDLYKKNELTSAINRIVEDINHRFTLEVLTKDFKSNDIGISANNMRHDPKSQSAILDNIDMEKVTNNLKSLLEIRNKNEMSVKLDNAHVIEIKEYLNLLDLIYDIDIQHLPHVNTKTKRTVITQPGLRYAQATALINSLLEDEKFSALSIGERNYVQERILNEIRGRMLEDIVLLETKLANPKKEVFVLQFSIGEFDMVIFDPIAANCKIFEIKHSTHIIPQQYQHLKDEGKCSLTEHRYGPITEKIVLYRGQNQYFENIKYQNTEDYLRNLSV